MGWLWWALPSQWRDAGVAVDAATAITASLAIPWALKFVWAPLVDVLRGRWFGYRGWLMVAQLGMAATLLPLLAIDPVRQWQSVGGLLLAHAFFAATQDVAIDGLAVASVPDGERGDLNGAMQAGMITGRLVFSTGLLRAESLLDVRVAVPGLLTVLGLALVLVACSRVTEPAMQRGPSLGPRRRRYLAALVRAPRIWRLAAFALFGGIGFEAAGALLGSWLVDRGLSPAEAGDFRFVTALLMIGGALVGGRLADRRGARGTAVRQALLLVLLLLLVAVLDAVRADAVAMVVFAAVYFGIGGFTAASYALFMQHANGPLAATLFSAFMGLTNGCEALSARLAGLLQVAYGYPVAIALPALLSLPALLLLLRRRR